MRTPLSPETITIIKATVPALTQHGKAISQAMYARLFQDDQIRALFNQTNQGPQGAQVQALAAAVLAYARSIDDLGTLGPVVERIAQKHIGFHILPEHYPFVATALLAAISDVLGAAATPTVLAAWGEAYWLLADIMKVREAAIRTTIEATPGGWHGWREFVVEQKTRESDSISSFVLRPKDGGKVVPNRPGQYLTLHIPQPDQPALKRNYSISNGPNDSVYRITVKREPAGTASKWLHDHIDVGSVLLATPPAGDFFLPERPERPIVLLSGGVGLTPMVSIVEAIANTLPDVTAAFVHGAISSTTHAMDRHVRNLATQHGGISVFTFYSRPESTDALGKTHDATGLITVEWLQANTSLADADFYLCGPRPFLRSLVTGLARAGVSAERVHYEFFGPADELIAA